MLCACGCGKELSKSRARISKYIKGHYHKMCKEQKTEWTLMMEERKKIRSNKKFMQMYKRLRKLEYALFKKPKKRRKKEYDMSILWK